MLKSAENISDREGRERSPDQSSMLDTIAGPPRLCIPVALLIALATGCGNEAKERDRCTDRAGRWNIADMKEKYPQDDIVCDPKTGIVYTLRKPLDGGVEDGGKE
jgi:hypothetical protein